MSVQSIDMRAQTETAALTAGQDRSVGTTQAGGLGEGFLAVLQQASQRLGGRIAATVSSGGSTILADNIAATTAARSESAAPSTTRATDSAAEDDRDAVGTDAGASTDQAVEESQAADRQAAEDQQALSDQAEQDRQDLLDQTVLAAALAVAEPAVAVVSSSDLAETAAVAAPVADDAALAAPAVALASDQARTAGAAPPQMAVPATDETLSSASAQATASSARQAQTATQSAAQTATQQAQAADLSARLGGAAVQVSVTQTPTATSASAQVSSALTQLDLVQQAQAVADVSAEADTASNRQGGNGATGGQTQTGVGVTQGTASGAASAASGAGGSAQGTGGTQGTATFSALLAATQAEEAAVSSEPAATRSTTTTTTMAGLSGLTSLSGADKSAQATAGVRTPRVPMPAEVQEQISVQISKAVKDGVDTVKIQLRPDTLGRIEVKLDVGSDGKVTATVTADNADTLSMLQKDVRGLEKALQDAGLKTDSGTTSFNLRGDAQNQTANRNGSDGSADYGQALLADYDGDADALAVLGLVAASSGSYASDSGVDISV